MSFFSKLFAKKEKQPHVDYVVSLSPECTQLQELNTIIDKLLNRDHYVARSEYLAYFSQYKSTVEYFSVLAKSGMLGSFCVQNCISDDTVTSTIRNFESLITLVDKANCYYRLYLSGNRRKLLSYIYRNYCRLSLFLTQSAFSL